MRPRSSTPSTASQQRRGVATPRYVTPGQRSTSNPRGLTTTTGLHPLPPASEILRMALETIQKSSTMTTAAPSTHLKGFVGGGGKGSGSSTSLASTLASVSSTLRTPAQQLLLNASGVAPSAPSSRFSSSRVGGLPPPPPPPPPHSSSSSSTALAPPPTSSLRRATSVGRPRPSAVGWSAALEVSDDDEWGAKNAKSASAGITAAVEELTKEEVTRQLGWAGYKTTTLGGGGGGGGGGVGSARRGRAPPPPPPLPLPSSTPSTVGAASRGGRGGGGVTMGPGSTILEDFGGGRGLDLDALDSGGNNGGGVGSMGEEDGAWGASSGLRGFSGGGGGGSRGPSPSPYGTSSRVRQPPPPPRSVSAPRSAVPFTPVTSSQAMGYTQHTGEPQQQQPQQHSTELTALKEEVAGLRKLLEGMAAAQRQQVSGGGGGGGGVGGAGHSKPSATTTTTTTATSSSASLAVGSIKSPTRPTASSTAPVFSPPKAWSNTLRVDITGTESGIGSGGGGGGGDGTHSSTLVHPASKGVKEALASPSRRGPKTASGSSSGGGAASAASGSGGGGGEGSGGDGVFGMGTALEKTLANARRLAAQALALTSANLGSTSSNNNNSSNSSSVNTSGGGVSGAPGSPRRATSYSEEARVAVASSSPPRSPPRSPSRQLIGDAHPSPPLPVSGPLGLILADFTGDPGENELSVREGDAVVVVQRMPSGWWFSVRWEAVEVDGGEGWEAVQGYVPGSYIALARAGSTPLGMATGTVYLEGEGELDAFTGLTPALLLTHKHTLERLPQHKGGEVIRTSPKHHQPSRGLGSNPSSPIQGASNGRGFSAQQQQQQQPSSSNNLLYQQQHQQQQAQPPPSHLKPGQAELALSRLTAFKANVGGAEGVSPPRQSPPSPLPPSSTSISSSSISSTLRIRTASEFRAAAASQFLSLSPGGQMKPTSSAPAATTASAAQVQNTSTDPGVNGGHWRDALSPGFSGPPYTRAAQQSVVNGSRAPPPTPAPQHPSQQPSTFEDEDEEDEPPPPPPWSPSSEAALGASAPVDAPTPTPTSTTIIRGTMAQVAMAGDAAAGVWGGMRGAVVGVAAAAVAAGAAGGTSSSSSSSPSSPPSPPPPPPPPFPSFAPPQNHSTVGAAAALKPHSFPAPARQHFVMNTTAAPPSFSPKPTERPVPAALSTVTRRGMAAAKGDNTLSLQQPFNGSGGGGGGGGGGVGGDAVALAASAAPLPVIAPAAAVMLPPPPPPPEVDSDESIIEMNEEEGSPVLNFGPPSTFPSNLPPTNLSLPLLPLPLPSSITSLSSAATSSIISSSSSSSSTASTAAAALSSTSAPSTTSTFPIHPSSSVAIRRPAHGPVLGATTKAPQLQAQSLLRLQDNSSTQPLASEPHSDKPLSPAPKGAFSFLRGLFGGGGGGGGGNEQQQQQQQSVSPRSTSVTASSSTQHNQQVHNPTGTFPKTLGEFSASVLPSSEPMLLKHPHTAYLKEQKGRVVPPFSPPPPPPPPPPAQVPTIHVTAPARSTQLLMPPQRAGVAATIGGTTGNPTGGGGLHVPPHMRFLL